MLVVKPSWLTLLWVVCDEHETAALQQQSTIAATAAALAVELSHAYASVCGECSALPAQLNTATVVRACLPWGPSFDSTVE